METNRVTLKDIYEAINQLRSEINDNYVTKQEFWPVKAIVYGGAAIVLTAVFSAMVYMAVQTR